MFTKTRELFWMTSEQNIFNYVIPIIIIVLRDKAYFLDYVNTASVP
jgi:superoxide dismutase